MNWMQIWLAIDFENKLRLQHSSLVIMTRYIRFTSALPHPGEVAKMKTWDVFVALCCPECKEYCLYFCLWNLCPFGYGEESGWQVWDSQWRCSLMDRPSIYIKLMILSSVESFPKVLVLVEHSCLRRVFAEFIVWFSISSLTSGFPMFRTLILASTVAKDKHRPDNKYLVIAHQEAAQNSRSLCFFLVLPKVF